MSTRNAEKLRRLVARAVAYAEAGAVSWEECAAPCGCTTGWLP